jgi:plastocyanin
MKTLTKYLAQLVSPLCLILLLSSVANATEITLNGSISFSGNPPLAALIYVPGKPSQTQSPKIDQVGKQFTESIVVSTPGAEVLFKNSDVVEHNVFANDAKHNAKFDVGLMLSGGEKYIPVNWDAGSMIRVGCKIHPRMRTYIATVNASFNRVINFSNAQKTFPLNLAGIPAGSQKLIIQIPKYDEIKLDLSKADSWTVAITKNGKQRGEITLKKGSH